MANQRAGKAASESPALKPYRGKPAVRNFRGGNGNVGIIRSPVRAIALPDYEKGAAISGAKRTPKTACTVSQRSSRSCPWASRIYVSADLEGIPL